MDRLLEGLTEAQRLAVTVDAPRLRILAGAGSGKTRVLTRRIAHRALARSLEPERTLVLTFTRKAAGELRQRLRSLGLDEDVSAGTFHAQAYAALRARWTDQRIRPPKVLDRRGRILYRVLPRSLDASDRLAVQTEIDWATARRVSPDNYPAAAERAGRLIGVSVNQVAEYYRRFVDEKARLRLVDFDDLLELCIQTMGDPDYAKARHWRHRYVFVDEFQDVNPLQYQLLRSWLGPESTLCVVGDPSQAIYGWNGADAAYLVDFEKHFPGSRTVELVENFRSTPQIVAAAEAVLGRRRLRAVRPDGPVPTVRALDDDAEEALSIARRVRDRHAPGALWSRQAVLVRTNAQAGVIVDALRRAEIPVSLRDGSSLLDDPAVGARLADLENDVRPLRSLVADLRAEAEVAVDEPVADASAELTPDLAAGLLRLAEDHLALSADSSAADFVAATRATARGERAGSGGDRVEVVTFHAAKGLEWSIVHLAGLEDGFTPISHARTPEALAEERRLVYVAITRARDELHCSWARRRRFGNRAVDRQPSVFLREIQQVLDGRTAAARSGDNLERVRAIRERLGVVDSRPPDDEVRENLRAWRRQAAKASSVPAYVVFDDRTLEALVESRPASLEDLESVTGLGPVRISRYGKALLALVSQAASRGATETT